MLLLALFLTIPASYSAVTTNAIEYCLVYFFFVDLVAFYSAILTRYVGVYSKKIGWQGKQVGIVHERGGKRLDSI